MANEESGSSGRGTHRNIGTADLAFETYAEYLDDRLTSFFGNDHLSSVDHGDDWDYVWDAKTLYEDGLFCRLLGMLDNQPSRAKWRHMKTADCLRCGEPEVGIIGVMAATETPSGELVSIDQHSELCRDCFETVLAQFEEIGELQPTLTTGKWWDGGGAVAE